MVKLSITILLAFILSACSHISKIEKVSESESHFKNAVYEGQDFYISEENTDEEKYRIFHQAASGFTGTSGIRNSAEIRAKAFCKEQGENKTMFKLSEHTAKPPYILGNFPRIEIIFACVDTAKPSSSSVNNKYDNLAKIKDLKDSGVLTDDEYVFEKKKILNSQ